MRVVAPFGPVCAVALSLLACAAPVANVPPPTPAPSVSAAAPIQQPPIEEPASPDVIRCGVDDAPVPLGLAAPPADLRLALIGQPLAFGGQPLPPPIRALLPTVTLAPRVEGVTASTQVLRALFRPCEEHVQVSEDREVRAEISFGANGSPRTSRPTKSGAGGMGPSAFGRCVAERACQLPKSPSLAGKSATAIIGVTVTPPVFRGVVTATVGSSLHPLRRPKLPPAKQAKVDALGRIIQAAGLRCAQRLPPADEVFLATMITVPAGGAMPITFDPSIGHGETLRACIQAELRDGGTKAAIQGYLYASLKIVGPPPGPLDVLDIAPDP